MAETIHMPKLGFDMAEGTLVRWVKKAGDDIHKGDVLAEIETDKATVEVESTASGVVRKLLVEAGAVVPVNTPIAVVGAADEQIEAPAEAASPQPGLPLPPNAQPPSSTVQPPSSAVQGQASVPRASPLARKLARDRQVDLSHVRGTGPGGRIVRRDIEQALSGPPAIKTGETIPAMQTSKAAQSIPAGQSAQATGITPTKLRQAIARRMLESKTSIPHFYVTHEYKMEALLALRRQINAWLPEEGKVSVNDFIVKAAALALRQYPNLNASLSGDKVLQHGAVNVGVAVSVEGGLLTVVCREADQMPLRQIALELKRMAAGAREGRVRPEDIEGSTFSISNLGMYDVESFVAIINPPEAAILAVGSAREVPVVENGEVKPGWRMQATLSVDHRLSDGAEAAQFLRALAVFLEEPLRLLV